MLTKKSIQFSSHSFLQSKSTVVIPLQEVYRAEHDRSNLGISDQISVYTNDKRHKFVVYGGREWVDLIEKARTGQLNIPPSLTQNSSAVNQDYTVELKKLKELLDAGIITEEEYAIKKRQILNI